MFPVKQEEEEEEKEEVEEVEKEEEEIITTMSLPSNAAELYSW